MWLSRAKERESLKEKGRRREGVRESEYKIFPAHLLSLSHMSSEANCQSIAATLKHKFLLSEMNNSRRIKIFFIDLV